MNYFSLSPKNYSKAASAIAPKGTKLSHLLIPDLEGLNRLPFEFNLVQLTVSKNGLIENNDLKDLRTIWLDYQPNSLAWPLMSENLKNTVLNLLTGKEGIDWITAIINYNGEKKEYFIPRFSMMLDVLDFHKTMFISGTNHIIKPVFSSLKINLYSMFHKPSPNNLWKITSGLYVKEEVMKAIVKAKFSGLEFEKTSVSE